MKILTINTMLNITSVGLVDSENFDCSLHLLSYTDEKQIENLLPALNEIFANSNKKLELIDRVVIVNGVGSFTSSRLAITVAKMIALVSKSLVFTVNTHDLLFHYAVDKDKVNVEDKKLKIVSLPATKNKNNCYYVKVFDSNKKNGSKNLEKICYITKEDLQSLVLNSGDYTVVTAADSKLSEIFNLHNIVVIDDFSDIHFTMFRVSLDMSCCLLNDLKPLYVKPVLLRMVNGEIREE